MILHLYFARKYLRYFLSVLLIFMIFISLIDFVEQLRRFGDDTGLGNIVLLTLLKAPDTAYETMPLIMILSSVWMFIALARSSELVVARSVGRSALQFLMAPVVVGGLIGVLTLVVFNPIVAIAQKTYDLRQEQFLTGRSSVFSIGSEGLWLRQGDADGQTVIRAARADADATRLFDVTFVMLDSDGRPNQRVAAQSAMLVDGQWIVGNARVWKIQSGENPEKSVQTLGQFRIPSTLTQDQIRDRFGTPSTVSIWNLQDYIESLQSAGFSAQRYAVWLQMELARPLYLVAMVLVGASFTMRHARFGGTGMAILFAVLLGFGLYYIRNFAQILGDNGQLPVWLAAWSPPLAGLLLSLGIILHTEDG